MLKGRLKGARAGVAKIAGGTAIGQLVAFAAAPLLSRIYSPEDFGVLTVVTTVAMTFAAVSALRLELAVPLPERDEDSYALAHLGLLACLAMTALGTVAVIVLADPTARAVGDANVSEVLWLAPLIGGTAGAFLVLNQLAVRGSRYGAIGRRNLLQSVVTTVVQLAAGLARIKPGGLIGGLLAGQAMGALSLLQGSGLRSAAARSGRRGESLVRNLRRYRRFPLILSWSALLNALGIHAPVFLFATYYGTQVAGWLGLTQRTLAMPVMLLGVAVAQVYLSELSRARREASRNIYNLFRATSRRLSVIAVLIAAPVLLLGPWIFGVVFGDEWTQSGVFAQALTLSLATQLVSSPLSHTLIVAERQGTQLAWDALRLVLCGAAVAVPAMAGQSASVAIWCFSTASAASYALSWLLSRDAARELDARERA